MREHIIIMLLGMLPFMMVLGNSMLIPILPEFGQALEITAAQTSFILSIFNIPAAIIIPIVGFLSDRYDRKTFILWSLLLLIIGGAICFFSGFVNKSIAFWTLLAGRLVQGLGTGGISSLAMSLAGDMFTAEKRDRALAVLEVFNGTAKVAAPILGALLALVAWYFPFILFPIIGTLLLFFILFFIKTSPSGEEKISLHEYVQRIADVLKVQKVRLLSLYLYGGTSMFLLFGLLYYLAYLIEELYHIDGFFKGFVYSFPLGALSISSYWTGKRLDYVKNRFLFLLVGMFMTFLSFFSFLIFQQFSLFLFFITISFGGLGFVLPVINSLIISSVDDAERGIVVSLYGMARFLGVALGPVVFSLWIGNEQLLFKLLFFMLSLVQCLLLYVFKNNWKIVCSKMWRNLQ
ncbi:MAG: MFS transporter [Bacillaceae bacterium]|uniref:MFS transporter n=1 Tax=Aeribacillus composti TaxID=1868734 RepID=UPI000E387965|nr:MAG: MFS transporter [Bacillaceae bacterium]